ncbi:MAG: exonuclease SbcCD subunit D C-terminal domain-containing protein [Saprospiraceae bacterium]|nr:exonuclease SbcCD subunit D C-terminal domain-containing protein [Saprospiraceae bacterium]MCF8249225.1 exonuclease SbcCD subunit D C-terminal domain-containing protein [Saprospiraceae bacterium]MCF8311354.1 exonuclease SbcCD subunit D C-terminal domain-containing protein [Saprospiraceae bacterium]MCF8442975.1 exonuclease SbcCD subunit D C-terminal domain-containing protein [Saprospiraceae bacterium]
MKILHTSDWHLGQKFISRDREEEHRLALDWLVQVIENEDVELLIVAGDVFDIGNPPNYARALYYGFLKKIIRTKCRHVVITGGNHDSPQMLDAPRELLQLLDVHVVGAATEEPNSQIIVLNDDKGEPEAVVAAVPFLRDQDLRRAATSDGGQDRVERIKEGILAHYEAVGKAAEPFAQLKIPMLVTAHLCVTGSEASDKQDNIYLGNTENIRADQFPDVFGYVALGHIHRPQAIGGMKQVRYCGSLIPLSFSETKDEKSVTLVEFKKDKLGKISLQTVPVGRRLKTIEGSFEEVQEKLESLNERYKDELAPWVEVLVDTDRLIPNLNGLLHDFTKDMHLEILKLKVKNQHLPLDKQLENEQLEDLRPIDVFRKKLESTGRPPEDMEGLVETFRELEAWMNERVRE